VIGTGSKIQKGCLIDKNVQVKENATLEESTVASCFTISTNNKGIISFVNPTVASENELFSLG